MSVLEETLLLEVFFYESAVLPTWALQEKFG